MVMMCPRRSRLILSTKAASVVDFPAPRGARYENEPARAVRQRGNDRGQAELCDAGDLVRDLPDRHGDAAALLEHVAPEPGKVLNAEREVQLVLGLEAFLLVLREDRVRDLKRVLRCQDVIDRGILELSVDPDLRPHTRRDMEVGGSLLDHLLKEEPEIDLPGRSRLPWGSSLGRWCRLVH